MEFLRPTDYNVIFWSGSINETRLRLDSCRNEVFSEPLLLFSALVLNKSGKKIYACANEENYQVRKKFYRKMYFKLTLVELFHLTDLL